MPQPGGQPKYFEQQIRGSNNVLVHRLVNYSQLRVEHLTTWLAVGGPGYNAPGGDYSGIAPYVDWAITRQGPAAARILNELNAAGIISVYYTDPNRQNVGGPEYTSDESTFAHDCSSNRILITKVPQKFYLMDPTSTDLYQLWIQEAQKVLNVYKGRPSYFFEDTADHINYVTAIPCNFTQPVWDAGTNAMDSTFESAVNIPLIYNAGDIHLLYGKIGVSPAVAIDPTTSGGLTEACFGNGFAYSRPIQFGINWQSTQAQLLKTQQDGVLTICHANAVVDGASQTAARLYVYASYLLTFLPGQSLFSEMYTSPSRVTVFPEIYLVPSSPLLPQPTSISQLQQTGGTYAREYANCDYYGVPVGPCAFVVNANQSGHEPFPFPGKYNATLRLSGYGVLDGGTATLDGGPPPATVAGQQAVVALLLSPPSPSPSPSPTDTPSPSPSPTDTPSPSPSPTDTPSPSPSPTDTPSPSPSPREQAVVDAMAAVLPLLGEELVEAAEASVRI